MSLRRYERAGQTLEDAISSAAEPLVTDVRYDLALCYERTRRRRQATHLLSRFLDEHPSDRRVPDALYRLGMNHWNLNQPEKAQSALGRVVGQHPQSWRAAQGLYILGRIAAEQGDVEEALRIFSQVVRDYPETSTANECLWQWGWLTYLSGDYERAAALFRQLARSGAEGRRLDQVSFWLGRAAEHLQDTEAAVEAYESVTRRFPLSYYAVRAGERLSILRGSREPELGHSVFPSNAPPQLELGSTEDLTLTEEDGYHAARAEELALLRFREDAREEIDLLAPSLPADHRHLAYVARLYAISENYLQSMRTFDKLYSNHIGKAGDIADLPSFILYGFFPLPYWEEVEECAARHGVDPLLIESIMRQESAFDHRAISPAGARGLLQLLPATALKVDTAVEPGGAGPGRLFDPNVNIAVGTQHFAEVLHLAGGNVVLALAAYNAGEHKIDEWQSRFPTGDMEEFIEQIPYAETRQYVKKVLRNHAVYTALYGTKRGGQSNRGGE